MSDLDAAVQPQCPDDQVVMRDAEGAWECPLCGRRQLQERVVMPPDFEGPAFPGF